MARARSYLFGVAWIALNDEPSMLDQEAVSGFISVALLADMFSKSSDEVARDVVDYRTRTTHEPSAAR